MKKYIVTTALMSAGLILSQNASAELFTNPANKNDVGQFALGVDYTSSEFTTIDDSNFPSDFERTIYSATGSYGISDSVDFYATVGVINQTNIDWTVTEGDGSLFAMGIKGKLTDNTDTNIYGFAQYLRSSEDFNGSELDSSVFSAGAAVGVDMDALNLYLSAEFLTGTFDFFGLWDEDNDDDFVIRTGGSYTVDDFSINAGLALVGENGFNIGFSKAF